MEQTKLLELLRSMSLEEKIGQLCQVPGVFYDGSAAVTGENWGTLSEEEMRLSGSTLGIWGAGKLRSIQERYMERHPHHIPLLFMLDVIHGHRTVFPCPLGQGATMDPELVQECARVQAREASSDGIHVTFSPMADLCRDARWGRAMESTGEDPYLSGKMASAMVRGYQGEDLSDPERVASCVKHFAAYGAPEAGRDYMNVELSEHTLRDQYMGGYEAAVKAGCEMVMSSFNTLNGVPCTGSRRLLHDILRDEWGFQGLVISDWGSVGEMVNHGFREDLKGAAEAAMEAGVDIDMCSGSYAGHLKELVLEGTIPESEIDQVALRVLELKNRLGLFEDPFRGCSGTRTEEIMLKEDHRALARKAVAASQVLLKNDGDVLPLGAGTHRIALIGPYADSQEIHSSWAVSCDKKDTVTLKAAFEEAGDFEIRCAKGSPMLDPGTHLSSGTYDDPCGEQACEAMLREAREAAAWADTVILCLGEHRLQSGECASRAMLDLPACQMRLLKAVRESARKLVTLIFCGRPLVLGDVADNTDALMISWMPGTEGGHGIFDVLTGREEPTGRLPMSFPRCTGQEPLHYDVYSTGRPPVDDMTAGFRSRFLDTSHRPLFPFGFGLSYGQVEISPIRLSGSVLKKGSGEHLKASVSVKNPGKRDVSTVLQLYIRDLVGSRVRPVRQLKGFQKVTVPGMSEMTVTFEIAEDELRFYTEHGRFEAECGKFLVFVGENSEAEASAAFELTD